MKVKVYVLLTFTGDGYDFDEVFETDKKAEDYAKGRGYEKHGYMIIEKELL